VSSSGRLAEPSISMGIVTWDKEEGISSERLVSMVESALKEAKENGRGIKVQYQFFSRSQGGGHHVIDKKR
jgi:GGDEF domain-containing protein